MISKSVRSAYRRKKRNRAEVEQMFLRTELSIVHCRRAETEPLSPAWSPLKKKSSSMQTLVVLVLVLVVLRDDNRYKIIDLICFFTSGRLRRCWSCCWSWCVSWTLQAIEIRNIKELMRIQRGKWFHWDSAYPQMQLTECFALLFQAVLGLKGRRSTGG